jgi:hypothetical protein
MVLWVSLGSQGLNATAATLTIVNERRLIAFAPAIHPAAQRVSKTAMAVRMKTSRRQLDRLLDPSNPSVTLATLRRAASAVGRRLKVELK